MDVASSVGVFYDDVFYTTIVMHWKKKALSHSLLQNPPRLKAPTCNYPTLCNSHTSLSSICKTQTFFYWAILFPIFCSFKRIQGNKQHALISA